MPGLRRLLGARRRPGLHARARDPAGEDRLRHRHRLRRALLLLHGHLRDARHPRPRAGARHRPGRRARRPLGVDRQRRRRRAVDRRQPPRPRAAPQRAGQDPALQQPHLRADQGPGVADQRARQGHEVDAERLDRAAARRALAGPGAGATFVARTVDRDKQRLVEVLRAAAQHRGAAFVEVLQNCPVFNDGAFEHVTDKDARPSTASTLVDGEPIRFGAERELRRRPRRRRRAGHRAASTTSAPTA